VIVRFSPSSPCPCESGQKIKNCPNRCLRRDGTLRPRPVKTRPPAPPTGFTNARCYAAPLNDCSTKITGEHTLSNLVLRELSPTGITEVSGLAGRQHDEFVSVPIGSFTCNVLCDRHNSALSSLDAGRVFPANVGRSDPQVAEPRVLISRDSLRRRDRGRAEHRQSKENYREKFVH
jgi:hypothetical protein